MYPNKTDKKSFKIEGKEIKLSNRLEQNRIAKECAEWIKQKVDIKSISGRNAILPDQQLQVSETTDFELITWLVIK